ncbi:RNA-directed DNA polymerase, eukaryota, reverse transcriptase zinc-binding domain protein [Tanacetum coccineum]
MNANFRMAAWNVKGICNKDMQKEVSNMKDSDKGCRIIVGWNEEEANVMVIHSCKQAILCLNEIIDSKQKFFCSFVYVANSGKERKLFWKELGRCKGGSYKTNDMIDFQECFEQIKVEDLNCSGIHFTWVQSRRAHKSRIEAISDEHGERFEVSNKDAEAMVKRVSDVEVKAALFDICDNKAPGPDGYSAKFYKKAWTIVGRDVCNVVKEFFKNGKIFGEVNATHITLVPKVGTPQKVSDYRPIACCNVLYKIISKILTNRIKHALHKLVNQSQSVFIPERQITINILLVQELLRGYNRKNGARRVALKIDIQKAYDTVNWEFLKESLQMFKFPKKMIKWIMVCIKTDAFTINVNNERFGYFKGERGLRKSGPMSPYIFTLVMEVFSLMQQIKDDGKFKYHWGCKELQISHLCFADDLLVLCYGNLHSVKVGSLTVTYLGVPLITKQLSFTDCKCLIDRVKAKVNNWMNKMLSYDVRLQLIASILSSMQVYWASVFILPKSVIKDIDKLLKGFFWCQGELSKGKAKVAWNQVCKSKEEGGLGIKDLSLWNEVLMSKHLWNVVSKKESIWLKWVTNNRLKGSSIWEVDCDKNASNGWKSILEPITKLISMDDVIQEGLYPNSKLNDMINRGKWRWPVTVQNNNVLKNIPVPKLTEGVKDDNCAPKHSFIMWMAVQNRLTTQEKLLKWSVLIRVINAACVYFIWTERNKRHFTNEKQSYKDLVDNVVYHVRLKLASLTVKWTEQVKDISRKWKIVFNVRNEDGQLGDALIVGLKWLDNSEGNVAKYAREICDAIVANCLTDQPETVSKVQIVFMLWVELEAVDAVLDAMEKAIKTQVAEAVLPALDVMFQAISEFGSKIVPPNRLLKMLLEIYDLQDQDVRASSKRLTLELCRWIGRDPVKSILFEKMSDTVEKELDAELANATVAAKPTRKIRFYFEPERKVATDATRSVPSEESAAEIPLEKDKYKLVDPVDILTPLEKSGFWNKVKSKIWIKRKEAVANLTKLASTKRIAPGEYTEFCHILEKLVTDLIIAVRVEAVRAIGNLALGLRINFSSYSHILLPVLLSKLTEKEPIMEEALTN